MVNGLMGVKIESFKGSGSQPWYFRLVATNGQIVLASEGYSRRWNRDRAVKRLRKLFPSLPEPIEVA